MLNVVNGDFGKVKSDEDTEFNKAAVIAFLERTLEQAKLEGATNVAVVMATADGGVMDGWSEARNMRCYTMIGGMHTMLARYVDTHVQKR